MAYRGGQYESVQGGSQALTAGVRALFKVDGTTSWVKKFTDAQRWDQAASAVRGMTSDEPLNIRWTTKFTPNSLLGGPFALHWEFDIGGTFGVFAEDWWEYPSTLGITVLGNAARTKSAALPFYVGPTWIANGCKVYVTAVGASANLANNAIFISKGM